MCRNRRYVMKKRIVVALLAASMLLTNILPASAQDSGVYGSSDSYSDSVTESMINETETKETGATGKEEKTERSNLLPEQTSEEAGNETDSATENSVETLDSSKTKETNNNSFNLEQAVSEFSASLEKFDFASTMKQSVATGHLYEVYEASSEKDKNEFKSKLTDVTLYELKIILKYSWIQELISMEAEKQTDLKKSDLDELIYMVEMYSEVKPAELKGNAKAKAETEALEILTSGKYSEYTKYEATLQEQTETSLIEVLGELESFDYSTEETLSKSLSQFRAYIYQVYGFDESSEGNSKSENDENEVTESNEKNGEDKESADAPEIEAGKQPEATTSGTETEETPTDEKEQISGNEETIDAEKDEKSETKPEASSLHDALDKELSFEDMLPFLVNEGIFSSYQKLTVEDQTKFMGSLSEKEKAELAELAKCDLMKQLVMLLDQETVTEKEMKSLGENFDLFVTWKTAVENEVAEKTDEYLGMTETEFLTIYGYETVWAELTEFCNLSPDDMVVDQQSMKVYLYSLFHMEYLIVTVITGFDGFDITGFEALDTITVDETERKEAENYLPSEVMVQAKGKDESIAVPVTWQCQDDITKTAYELYTYEMVLGDGAVLSDELQEAYDNFTIALPWIDIKVVDKAHTISGLSDYKVSKAPIMEVSILDNERKDVQDHFIKRLSVILENEKKTDIPVTWTCDKDITTSEETEFYYSVVLPKEYAFNEALTEQYASGKSLIPTIKVTILPDGDGYSYYGMTTSYLSDNIEVLVRTDAEEVNSSMYLTEPVSEELAPELEIKTEDIPEVPEEEKIEEQKQELEEGTWVKNNVTYNYGALYSLEEWNNEAGVYNIDTYANKASAPTARASVRAATCVWNGTLNRYYTTLSAATAASRDHDVLYITGDVHDTVTAVVSKTITILPEAGKQVGIFASSVRGTTETPDRTLLVYGHLTLSRGSGDSTGKITFNGANNVYSSASGLITVTGNASLTVNTGISIWNATDVNGNKNTAGIHGLQDSVININGANISDCVNGIASYGKVNVSSGVIYNNTSDGIQLNGKTNASGLNVTGGTFRNNETGIHVAGNDPAAYGSYSCTISNANIYSNGTGIKVGHDIKSCYWDVTFYSGNIYSNSGSGVWLADEKSSGQMRFNFRGGSIYSNGNAGIINWGHIINGYSGFIRGNGGWGIENHDGQVYLNGDVNNPFSMGFTSWTSDTNVAGNINKAGNIYNTGGAGYISINCDGGFLRFYHYGSTGNHIRNVAGGRVGIWKGSYHPVFTGSASVAFYNDSYSNFANSDYAFGLFDGYVYLADTAIHNVGDARMSNDAQIRYCNTGIANTARNFHFNASAIITECKRAVSVSNSTFNMYGGTISNCGTGTRTIDYGAGISLTANGKLNMSGGSITGNVAQVDGGGVHINGGSTNTKATFNMSGGSIYSNTAKSNAGGVMNYIGNVTMTGGTIYNNVSSNATLPSAIYNAANGSFNMKNGAIYGNIGWGIYNLGTATIQPDNTSQCPRFGHANGTEWASGALDKITYRNNTKGNIYNSGSGVLSINTDKNWVCFANNESGNGRQIENAGSGRVGIWAGSSGTYFAAFVGRARYGFVNYSTNDNGTNRAFAFHKGTLKGAGTGVYNKGNCMIQGNVTDSTVNGVECYGGNTYLEGSALIQSNNKSRGVYVGNTAKLTMSNGQISNNKATVGGGIYVANGGTATINKGTISNNTAVMTDNSNGYGGGILVEATGKLTITGAESKITGNTGQNYGGGIFTNAPITLTDCKITGNKVTSNRGGGIYVNPNATTTINGAAEISGNSAPYGGGIATWKANLNTGDKVVINNNIATTGSGGGIDLRGGTNKIAGTISGNVCNNTSGGGGGGIFACTAGSTAADNEPSNTTITANVSGNTATYGGGVFVDRACTVNLTTGNIYSNTGRKSGGGVGVQTSNTELKAATFNMSGGSVYKNTASEIGGGICVYGGNGICNLTGGTIYTNTAPNGKGIYVGGVLNMSKAATVNANNDVYLSANRYINVPAALTSTGSIATVTPDTYTLGRKCIQNSCGTNLGSELYQKFTLTPYQNYLFRPGDYQASQANTADSDVVISQKYSITYDKNAEFSIEVPKTGLKYWYEKASVDSKKMSSSEATFLGWDEDTVASKPAYQPGSAISESVNKDLTLHAIWQYGIKVTYIAKDYTDGTVQSEYVTKEQCDQNNGYYDIQKNAGYTNYKRDAHTFYGWTYDSTRGDDASNAKYLESASKNHITYSELEALANEQTQQQTRAAYENRSIVDKVLSAMGFGMNEVKAADTVGEKEAVFYATWDKAPRIHPPKDTPSDQPTEETPIVIENGVKTFYEGTDVTKEMLLEGVTSTDDEDGSITSKLRIVKIEYSAGKVTASGKADGYTKSWTTDMPDDYLLDTWFMQLDKDDSPITHKITYAVTDSVGNTTEKTFDIRVKYNEFPTIETEDRYYTLEEAQKGMITEQALLDESLSNGTLKVEDQEDDILYPDTIEEKTEILNFHPEEFTAFKDSGYVVLTYSVKDSMGPGGEGKETLCQFIVYVVKDGEELPEVPERTKYLRFINQNNYEKNYGLDVDAMTEAEMEDANKNGGLNVKSVWYSNPEYVTLLRSTWTKETPQDIWSFSNEKVKEVKEYVEDHGIGNAKEPDALANFVNQFK